MNQPTRDLLYTQSKFTQKGSCAYVATEGSQQKYSKNLFNSVLEIDVKCTPKQIESIANALPHEILVYNPPKQSGFESHAHLSYLTSYVQSNVMSMDFTGQSIKVIGAKFNKKEVTSYASAEKVHFCLNDPLRTDEFRQLSSARAISKMLERETKERELTLDVIRQSEQSAKKINLAHSSVDVQTALDRISEISTLSTEFEQKSREIEKLREWSRVINDRELQVSEHMCTVGAENCTARADIYISNDSLYDIRLPNLLANAAENGVKEVWVCAILPFGLKHSDAYYSDELDVHFSRRTPPASPLHSRIMRAALRAADPTGVLALANFAQNMRDAFTVDFTDREAVGFSMIHGSDMSNGYIHDNPSFLKLLYTNFVVAKHDVTWAFEIVQNVAEICCIRFVRVDTIMLKRVIRKEMPSCFNDFYVTYDPLKYFSKYPTYELMLIPKKKLNSAIFFVQRAESTNKIVEKVLAHVQSTFLKVEVGGSVLQEGGEACPDLVDSIVLIALIEGSARKHGIGEAWKRSNWSGSICRTLFRGFCDYVNSLWMTHYPGLTKFFTQTAAQKYMACKQDLASLALESQVDTSSFAFWWDILKSEFDDARKKVFLERHSLTALVRDPSIIAREYKSLVDRGAEERKRIAATQEKNRTEQISRIESIVTERQALEEQISEMKKRLEKINGWVVSNEEAEELRAEALEHFSSGDEADVADDPDEVYVPRGKRRAGTPKHIVSASTTGLQDSIAQRDGTLKVNSFPEIKTEVMPPTSTTLMADRIAQNERRKLKGTQMQRTDVVSPPPREEVASSQTVQVGRVLRGVQLQRARRDVGTNERALTRPSKPTVQLGPVAARKFTREACELEMSKAMHEPFSFVGGIPQMDEASEKALAFNRMRMRDGELVLLGDPEKRKLREAFTVEGALAHPVVSPEVAREYIRKIYATFFVESGYDCAEMLRKCKTNMQALAKRILEGADFTELASKVLNVVNGYAGSGKTSYALSAFDPDTCAYIVPYAGVLADTRDEVKRKYRDANGCETTVSAKTFENISKPDGSLDILASGEELVIDECSGIPVELIVLILLATNFKKYTLIGDVEQTAYFDTLGTLSGLQFTSLVRPCDVTVFRFTYRYGPTVAAFLNYALNYPVVSLRNEDTAIYFHSEEEITAGLVGFNVCVSTKTRDKYENKLGNINCSGSTQGRTVGRVNIILSKSDPHSFLAHRETGIVSTTRVTTELHLYIDLESKSKKSVNHILDFQTNYAAIFDVVIPTVSNFQ